MMLKANKNNIYAGPWECIIRILPFHFDMFLSIENDRTNFNAHFLFALKRGRHTEFFFRSLEMELLIKYAFTWKVLLTLTQRKYYSPSSHLIYSWTITSERRFVQILIISIKLCIYTFEYIIIYKNDWLNYNKQVKDCYNLKIL